MKIFSFEKLDVWQKGRQLVKLIYLISSDFPSDERFGLTQQIRRACVSVTCNLAEGISRSSGNAQAYFTEISFGSLMEVLNLMILAHDLAYIPEDQLMNARLLIQEIANKLNSLKATQLSRKG